MNKINKQTENYKPFSFHAIKLNVTVKKFRINKAICTQKINIVIYYDEIQQTHTRI